jgi:toxin HigB-1
LSGREYLLNKIKRYEGCCALRNMLYNSAGVIKSFKHKGLKKFFESGNVSGINPAHRRKLRIRLAALDTAAMIGDMDLPGFQLHTLKGDKQNLWAIDVSKNRRITFEFKDGDAYVVNYEDYH